LGLIFHRYENGAGRMKVVKKFGELPDYIHVLIVARCEICQKVVEDSYDEAEDIGILL